MDQPVAPAVHIWYCSTDDESARARHDHYLALLSAEENERRAAFRLQHSRWEFLLAHALLRTMLSRYHETAPEAWEFEIEGNGKPCLPPDHPSGLKFNLSHTRGWVAVAISQDCPVGVDVQHIRERSVEDLATHVLAPWEQDYLRRESADPHQDFFRFWTLKEAYLKATGVGLAARLEAFGFDLHQQPPELRFELGQEAEPAPFHFCEHLPDESVKLAVASWGAPRPPAFVFERARP